MADNLTDPDFHQKYSRASFKLLSILNDASKTNSFLDKICDILQNKNALGKDIGILVSIHSDFKDKDYVRNLTPDEVSLLISQNGKTKNTPSVVSTPIKTDVQFGYLTVISKSKDLIFDKDEKNLIQAVAEVIASRLSKRKNDILISSELYTRESLTNLETIFNTFTDWPLELLLRIILDEARRLTHSNAAYCCLADAENTSFSHETTSINDENLKSFLIAEAQNLCKKVLQSKNMVKGVSSDVDCIFKNYIAMPAMHSGKIIGVIVICNTSNPYTKEQLDSIKYIAGFYSLILHQKLNSIKHSDIEKHYSTFLSYSSDIIFTINLDGIVLYISDNVSQFGYKVEDVVGHHLSQFMPKQDIAAIRQSVIKAIKLGRTDDIFKFKLLTSDGKIRILQQHSDLIKKDGKAIAVAGVIRDITGLEQKSKDLDEIRLLYKTLFDNNFQALILSDTNTKQIIDVNKRAEEMFCCKKKDLIGIDYLLIHSREAQEEIKEKLNSSLEYARTHSKPSHTITYESTITNKKGLTTAAVFLSSFVLLEDKLLLLTIILDVQKEKQNQKKIDFQLNLLDNTKDFIYAVDTDGIILYANKTLCKYYGYKANELIGQHISILSQDKQLNLSKRRIDQIKNSKQLTYTAVTVTKNNHPFQTECNSTYVRIDDKDTIITVSRDITERVKLEENLKNTTSTLTTLLQAIPDYVQIIDSQKKLKYINKEMTRYNSQMGSRQEDIFPKDIAEIHNKYLKQIDKTGKPVVLVESLLDKNNNELWVEHRAFPLLDKVSGKSDYLILSRDFTNEKRQKEHIQNLQAILDTLFINSRDFCYVLDLNGKITMLNKAASTMMNKTEAELIGKTLKELNFTHHEAISQEVQEVLRTKKPLNKTYSTVLGGKIYHINVLRIPIFNTSGEVTSIFCVGHDVTDIKAAVEHEVLDTAQKAVGATVRPMIHDLNNMLTIINGYATLILEDLKSDSKLKMEINHILTAVSRATKLTSEVQTFARNPNLRKINKNKN